MERELRKQQRPLSRCCLAAVVIAVLQAVSPASAATTADSDFVRDVWPVLSDNCLTCHGPFYQLGGLRLDSRERIARGSKNGPILEPGEPDTSELVRRVSLPEDDVDRMPQKAKRLTPEEIELIRAWIEAGAEFGGFVDAESLP